VKFELHVNNFAQRLTILVVAMKRSDPVSQWEPETLSNAALGHF
jgi:hypothetical protein